MAAHSAVIAALRVLTSVAPQKVPVKGEMNFQTILASNLRNLATALQEDTELEIVRGILDSLDTENLETITQMFNSTRLKEKENGGGDSEDKAGVSVGNSFCFNCCTRWTFVQACLALMKSLQESLVAARKSGKDRPNEHEKNRKRKGDAKPTFQDLLSISDQKTTLTAIQFVVSLGICPNLLFGVGIPLERRSEFAKFVKMECCATKNERHLYQCVECLISCIQQPSLGSLVLSRHLGDILAGLLQICHAPPSSYLEHSKTNAMSQYNNRTKVVACNTSNSGAEAVSGGSGCQSTACSHSGVSAVMAGSKLQVDAQMASPAQIHQHFSTVNKQSVAITNDEGTLFITPAEREKCTDTLHSLLKRVYQPIVVRELLVIQGGAGSGGCDTSKGAPGAEKKCRTRTPTWLKDVCGSLLSERLMETHGVRSILHGLLEADAGVVQISY